MARPLPGGTRASRLASVAVLLAAAAPVARAQSFDLTAGSGGFTASTIVDANPWSWAPGVGWSVRNVDRVARSRLLSPVLTPGAGAFTLALQHAFSFETRWDGGTVWASVDDAPFAVLAPAAGPPYQTLFPVALGSLNPLAGTAAFTGANGIATSTFTGSLAAGQSIRLAFDASWDGTVAADDPAWRLLAVTVSTNAGGGGGGQSVVPEPSSWALIVTGVVGLALAVRRRRA